MAARARPKWEMMVTSSRMSRGDFRCFAQLVYAARVVLAELCRDEVSNCDGALDYVQAHCTAQAGTNVWTTHPEKSVSKHEVPAQGRNIKTDTSEHKNR
jgi:hypothetical protein